MRVTVTGATGFVGQALVPHLEAGGHSVHILSRTPRTGLPPGVRLSIWDPEKNTPPEESLTNCDVLVHMAGEPISQRWNSEIKRRIRASRVDGTRRLIEGLQAASPRPSVLISSSAIGIYGDRGDEQLDESAAAGTGFVPEVCVEWEKAAAEAEASACAS